MRYILVSGSRGWPHPEKIIADLDRHRARLGPGDTLVVIHGGARKGADAIASAWVRRHRATRPRSATSEPALADVAEWVFPADWGADCRPECASERGGHGPRRVRRDGSDYCPAQGNYRNQRMVDAAARRGAFVALVYILNESSGAADCLERLRAARINTTPILLYT